MIVEQVAGLVSDRAAVDTRVQQTLKLLFHSAQDNAGRMVQGDAFWLMLNARSKEQKRLDTAHAARTEVRHKNGRIASLDS